MKKQFDMCNFPLIYKIIFANSIVVFFRFRVVTHAQSKRNFEHLRFAQNWCSCLHSWQPVILVYWSKGRLHQELLSSHLPTRRNMTWCDRLQVVLRSSFYRIKYLFDYLLIGLACVNRRSWMDQLGYYTRPMRLQRRRQSFPSAFRSTQSATFQCQVTYNEIFTDPIVFCCDRPWTSLANYWNALSFIIFVEFIREPIGVVKFGREKLLYDPVLIYAGFMYGRKMNITETGIRGKMKFSIT